MYVFASGLFLISISNIQAPWRITSPPPLPSEHQSFIFSETVCFIMYNLEFFKKQT